MHTTEWRKKARDTFANMTAGPVFVQSSLEPFLAWDDVRRMGNMRSVVDVRSGRRASSTSSFPRRWSTPTRSPKTAARSAYNQDIQKKTDYDSFGSRDVAAHAHDDRGARAPSASLFATTKGMQIQWADDGRHYAYSKDGRVYAGSIADKDAKLLAGPPEAKPGETSLTRAKLRVTRSRSSASRVVRYSPAGDAVVVSNREGLWLVDVATKRDADADRCDATTPATTTPRVRARRVERRRPASLLCRASRARSGSAALLRFDRGVQQAHGAREGRALVLRPPPVEGRQAPSIVSIANGNRPADIYVADASLGGMRRLVESNPQLTAKRIGTTELVTYLDADGHPKYAVVYYPADYQKGKAYPTVFERL